MVKLMQNTYKCSRALLFGINVAILFIAVLLIALGGVLRTYSDKYDPLVQDYSYHRTETASSIFIAAGAFLAIFSTLGCLSAVVPVFCFLAPYMLSVTVIFTCHVAIIVVFNVYGNRMYDFIEEGMLRSLKDFNDTTFVRDSWNQVQYTFGCCGVDSACDWQLAKNLTRANDTDISLWIPDSCCSYILLQENCTLMTVQTEYIEGCFRKFKKFLRPRTTLVYGVGTLVAVVEVACLYLSFVLLKGPQNVTPVYGNARR